MQVNNINRIILTVNNLEKIVASCQNEEAKNGRRKEILSNIRNKENEIKTYETALSGAEEKWFLGKIDDEKYEHIQKKYQSEIRELKITIQILEESLQSTDDILSNVWIHSLLEKRQLENIDSETVIEMIESINIYHDNRLEINYKFSKELEVLFAAEETEA